MSYFINSDLGVWKSGEMQQVFLPHELSMILGIPLSPRNPPDRVVWAHSQFGLFTTSSAYKLLVASASASYAGSSILEPQKIFLERNLIAACTQ